MDLKARLLSVLSTLSSLLLFPSSQLLLAGDSPLALETDLSLELKTANQFLIEIPGEILAFGRPSSRTTDKDNGFPAIFKQTNKKVLQSKHTGLQTKTQEHKEKKETASNYTDGYGQSVSTYTNACDNRLPYKYCTNVFTVVM
jgi:hypothetical protein